MAQTVCNGARLGTAVLAAVIALASPGAAAAQTPNSFLFDIKHRGVAASDAHREAAFRCDRAGMASALAVLERNATELRRAAEEARAAGQDSQVSLVLAENFAYGLEAALGDARRRKPRNCDETDRISSVYEVDTKLTEAQKAIADKIFSDRVETILSAMESARLRGDCEHMQRLNRALQPYFDSKYAPATLPDWRRQANAILQRPCPPPDRPPRVENLREEIEEGLRRQGERRRKELSGELKPDEQTLLDLHNKARSAVGVPPLDWDLHLAANAQLYANRLAQTGQLAHAPREGRGIERENLSKGLVGWNADQLMESWLAERRLFKPGAFPNVSTTGNWYDVGHYSQMIWPETTDIGCGIATGSGFSWLVCRYSPGGNKDGKPVGLPPGSR